MLRKLFPKSHDNDQFLTSSFASSAAMSLIEDFHPLIVARDKGDEMTPFTTALLPYPDPEASFALPKDLSLQWERLYATLVSEKSSLRSGVDTLCYFRLLERMNVFRSVAEQLENLGSVPGAFVQVLLMTVRDVVNGVKEGMLVRMGEFFQAEDCEQVLGKFASDTETLFLLVQHCVIHDHSRLLLSQDFLRLLCSFYKSLVESLPATPSDLKSVDFLKLFYCATQGVYAVGELISVHEEAFAYMPEVRGRVVNMMRDAIFAINSDAKLMNLCETQFMFFTANQSLSLCFRPKATPYIDLSLILLVDLYNLSKSFSTLPDLCQGLLRTQLSALVLSFRRYKAIDDRLSEVFCLFDKYLIVLHFFKSLIRQHKLAGVRMLLEHQQLLKEVMLNCCWFFVKWECPLYGESFKEDEGRLGKLYQLLLDVFEGLIGTADERLPLGFFAGLPEWIENDYTKVCEDRPGVLQTYTLELISDYLQLFSDSKAYSIVLESNLLALLLTPFFQLVPTVLQHSPFDVAELPTTTNLAHLCSSYLTQTLKILLRKKEGKLLFLQEFIKGFQQYKANIAYITKLGRLMNEMVSNEEKDWVDLLAEMHLVDYIFQVVIDSKTLIESPESMKPLQVTITSMLKIPQLAANLLQQKIIVKRTEELIHSAESAEFCMEVLGRLLACNASEQLYKRFAHVLHKEKSETVVRLLFQSIEVALSAKTEGKRLSQRFFIENSVLEVALKRFEEFKSLSFCSVALPSIRAILHKSEIAIAEMTKIGFSGLKNTLLSILDSHRSSIADFRDMENLIDNLLFILFDTNAAVSNTVVTVPEIAEIVIQVIIRSGDEAIQNRYFDTFCEATSRNEENRLILSQSGMLKHVLRFFTVTQNRDLRLKCLTLISGMTKEHFSPEDLLCLISLINDDTKASYPSSITTDLLLVVKDAFGSRSRSCFRFQRGHMIVSSLKSPKRSGFTVVIWAKLYPSATGLSHSLLTFSNFDNSKMLKITVSPTGVVSITYFVKGSQTFQCSAGVFPCNSISMLGVTYQPRTALKQKYELDISVDSQLQPTTLLEGKLKLEEDVFDSVSFGSGDGFEGQLFTASLFLSACPFSLIQDLHHYGPLFNISSVADGFTADFGLSSAAIRVNRIREAISDLVLALHPCYVYDTSHAVNIVHRLHASKWSDFVRETGSVGAIRSESDTLLFPLMIRVKTDRRIGVGEAMGCLGGVKVLFPLLKRLDKQIHLKSVVHPLLELVTFYLSSPCSSRWLSADPSLLPTLQTLLEALSHRLSFKTSTAILILTLKDTLPANSALQMSIVESFVLNCQIWSQSKRTIQTMLVSVDHSNLYIGRDRVRLIAKIIEFCLCVADLPSSPTGARDTSRKVFMKKAAELIKSYTVDSEIEDISQPVLRELFKSMVDYEPSHIHIVHLSLKLVSFFAKRGSVKATAPFLHILLYLLRKDSDGSRGYTRRVLHILKMTLMDAGSQLEDRKSVCEVNTLVAFLNKYMKMKLTPRDYYAVLSLMLHVPELSPKQTQWSTRYPDLPYKDGYKELIGEYRDVIIRFPMVIDVVTSRLVYNVTEEVVEDLGLIAEQHIEVLFSQDSFPEWLITLWRQLDSQSTENRAHIRSLSISIFAHSILHLDITIDRFRRFIFFLINETTKLAPLVPEILSEILDALLSFPDILENNPICKGNLLPFAYLFEDVSCALHNSCIESDPIIAVKFIEVMKIAKILHLTAPPIPLQSISEALANCSKSEDAKARPESREGGVNRIALKVAFQYFRNASESAFSVFFPLLRSILHPILLRRKESFLSLTSPDRLISGSKGRKPNEELLSDPQFMSVFLMAELTDIVIHRRSEANITLLVSNCIKSLNDTYRIMTALESQVLAMSSEDYTAIRRFVPQYANASVGAVVTAGRLNKAQIGLMSWWDADSYESMKVKLTSVLITVLKPAFAKDNLADVLLSDDWISTVHPFCLLTSSFILTITSKPPSSQLPYSPPKGRSISSVDQMMETVLGQISRINQKRNRKRRLCELDSLYVKTQWRTYYKWQTREAGLWVKSPPSNAVWKVDPEFDLELKCPRLRLMLNRSQAYYTDKANKKTQALLTSEPQFHRRQSRDRMETITPRRRNCATIAVDCEESKEFADMIMGNSPLTPQPELPLSPIKNVSESIVAVNDCEDVFECERIQPKGASFGVLKISPKYVLFESAKAGKGTNLRYFAGALVRISYRNGTKSYGRNGLCYGFRTFWRCSNGDSISSIRLLSCLRNRDEAISSISSRKSAWK